MDNESLAGLQCITEDSPQLLIEALQRMKEPMKIVQFIHTGTKASAYIVVNTAQKKKGK